MKKKKKRKKKSLLKALKGRLETLWKLACKTRDGFKCAMKEVFPHECSQVLQVDHCWSRMNSEIFFDIRNGTTLCSSMHTMKTYCCKGAEKVVDDFVRKREGDEWWENAKAICMKKGPYVWDVITLEQKIIEMKEKIAEFLEKKDQ